MTQLKIVGDIKVSSLAGGDQTLTGAAYKALRRDIISGTREPNERLKFDNLRQLYGVGLTPLREALQRLTADGLVVSEGMRGFHVAPLNSDDFRDLNIARTALETQALRLSIKNGDDAWEANIVAAAYRLKKVDNKLKSDRLDDLNEWEQRNREFHYATVVACGSDWLLRIRSNLHDQCERYRLASVALERSKRNLHDEHEEITEAILHHDADRACQLIEDHFGRTTDILMAELETRTGS